MLMHELHMQERKFPSAANKEYANLETHERGALPDFGTSWLYFS